MIDHNDIIELNKRIDHLQQEQVRQQHSYSIAKQTLAVSKDRKRRLLAQWVNKGLAVSDVARTNWALAQNGYIEEIGKIEVQDLAAQQTRDAYELLQPQLDMLRSQLSLAKAQIEHL